MSSCKDICLKYKKIPRFDTPYSRYCPTCSLFLEYEGISCPCCNTKLRIRPRTARRQRKYFENHPEQEPKRIA